MKTRLVFAIMCLNLFATHIMAQVSDYVPFVREGVQWVCTYNNRPFTLELKGDVVIGGKAYKAMHKYSGDAINTVNDTIPVYLREEGKIVYGIVPEGKTYADCPIGINGDATVTQLIESGQEFVLYDFNDFGTYLKNTDCFSRVPYLSQVILDKTTIKGQTVKRYIFGHSYDLCLIEGIGYDGLGRGSTLFINPGSIGSESGFSGRINLSHVIENGEVIYNSEINRTVDSSDSYVPIIREGVQWVNEKVTVNHGDTTYSYYTYEFKGENWQGWPVCYYYTGKIMEYSPDVREVAVFLTGYESAFNYREYKCISCEPLEKVINEGRSMYYRALSSYPGDSWPLYCFSNLASDIDYFYSPNYFIYYEGGNLFSRENYIEVEPVLVNGEQCSRFAYLDEEGNPLAYIVEGIGFDSRDMGDLLTPFTRKPDPDADYQEYCGLSHVIKDGKIIYKGMRFDPSKVYGIPGDMNGDGEIGVDDLALLIDRLLTDMPRYTYTGDFSGDGAVDIADVSSLIDYLLTR